MKKYLISLIVGLLALSIAFNAYAVTNPLIGQTIQNALKVTINGEELDNDALIVNGVSYVPLREAAERLMFEVEFVEGESINLVTSSDSGNVINNLNEVNQNEIDILQSNIDKFTESISRLEGNINRKREQIQEWESQLGNENVNDEILLDYINRLEKSIETVQMVLDKEKEKLAKYQAELEALTSQPTE